MSWLQMLKSTLLSSRAAGSPHTTETDMPACDDAFPGCREDTEEAANKGTRGKTEEKGKGGRPKSGRHGEARLTSQPASQPAYPLTTSPPPRPPPTASSAAPRARRAPSASPCPTSGRSPGSRRGPAARRSSRPSRRGPPSPPPAPGPRP